MVRASLPLALALLATTAAAQEPYAPVTLNEQEYKTLEQLLDAVPMNVTLAQIESAKAWLKNKEEQAKRAPKPQEKKDAK